MENILYLELNSPHTHTHTYKSTHIYKSGGVTIWPIKVLIGSMTHEIVDINIIFALMESFHSYYECY